MNQTNANETPATTPSPATEAPAGPKPRGFAAISPERRREIASRGGKAAHAAGTAHTFSTDEAKAAGTKGGSAPHASRGRKPNAEQQ